MIKFSQVGPDDTWVVFLGITLENLDRIANHMEPIVFKADQVGLGAGSFAVGTGGMGAALRAQLGASELRSCLELTQEDADLLTSGGLVERSLQSLGFSRKGTVMVLLGKTEASIVESLRAAGLISATTKLTELSPPVARTSKLEPPPRMADAFPQRRQPNFGLIFSGLFFMALGGLGIGIGKNAALGALLALAGAAVAVWGFLYVPPRAR
jgi:hypothetical protein